jgi:hypothetical protein
MQIPVLVERMNENGYRARSGEPLPLAAEGATQEEAIRRLRALYTERLVAGARIVAVDIPAENPWLQMAGFMKDDPMFEEWREAIAENRRRIEADPEIP